MPVKKAEPDRVPLLQFHVFRQVPLVGYLTVSQPLLTAVVRLTGLNEPW